MTRPSSRLYTASGAASMQGAWSQWLQKSGVYSTRTLDTWPWSVWVILHQKCPVSGWGSA